jgi:uncharacterized DUF497 family protein
MTTVRFDAGEMAFEWDTAKAGSNKAKHRVSFEEAATSFLDPLARLFDDPDARGERRFLLVGVSAMTRLLLVVHVEGRDRLRIISARLATPHERSNLETEA